MLSITLRVDSCRAGERASKNVYVAVLRDYHSQTHSLTLVSRPKTYLAYRSQIVGWQVEEGGSIENTDKGSL